MRRRALLPLALLLAPGGAAAAPSFKSAPAGDKSGEEQAGGWSDSVALDVEALPPWLHSALEFLSNNYGYMGVAAVLLMLLLFARGAGGRTAAEPIGGDEDFFEPGDSDRYGDPR